MQQLVLGIDIGGTTTKMGLVTASGEVVAQHRLITTDFDTAEALALACRQWLQSQDADKQAVSGIGIGAPNGNFYTGNIEFAPNLRWKGIVPLRDIFRRLFDMPVWVTNDANAAAIGEGIYGAAKGLKDYLVVTLGTGVGSGFVANGQLIYGHDGFAGELGHTIVRRGGRTCGCGRQGCLETYASATGIVRTALEYLQKNEQTSLLQQKNKEELSAEDIFVAAEKGDALAVQIFEDTAQELGFALAQAVAVSSPEMIVLFGGLAQAGDLLLQPTRRYMESYLLPIYQNKIKLLSSSVPSQYAAILGAAALAVMER